MRKKEGVINMGGWVRTVMMMIDPIPILGLVKRTNLGPMALTSLFLRLVNPDMKECLNKFQER